MAWLAYWAGLAAWALGTPALLFLRLRAGPPGHTGNASLSFDGVWRAVLTVDGAPAWSATVPPLALVAWVAVPPLVLWLAWLLVVARRPTAAGAAPTVGARGSLPRAPGEPPLAPPRVTPVAAMPHAATPGAPVRDRGGR